MGTAPSVCEVAQALGLPIEHVLTGFQKLAESDLIVSKEGKARLLSAYPFSGVSTAHQVLTDAGTPLYTMCAIDALGIPFMLGQGASVRSACFFCQQLVRVDIAGGLLQRSYPSTSIVWFSERDGWSVRESPPRIWTCNLANQSNRCICHACRMLGAHAARRYRGMRQTVRASSRVHNISWITCT
jgi:alkylmercury lyase-like protein